ncbi:MAG: hypothetical protein RL236_585 [Pseudomonadota bacterium]|jgi:hypothetical protein
MNEEFTAVNEELIIQLVEKEECAAELVIANRELVFQNTEKERRVSFLKKLRKSVLF